jgi:hypothetical protein
MAKSKLTSPGGVDSKLLHLVRKLVNPSGEESVEHLINRLKLQNREYQRKDPVWLNRHVEKALFVIHQDLPMNSNKRSLDEIEEERYDHEARDSDTMRAALLTNPSACRSTLVCVTNTSSNKSKRKAAEEKMKQETLAKAAKRLKRRKIGPESTDPSRPAFLTPVPRPTERYKDFGWNE